MTFIIRKPKCGICWRKFKVHTHAELAECKRVRKELKKARV